MSMDKAIEHHKEFRKRYYGAKSIDPTCRNHGDCLVCQENRTYGTRKRLMEWQRIGRRTYEQERRMDYQSSSCAT